MANSMAKREAVRKRAKDSKVVDKPNGSGKKTKKRADKPSLINTLHKALLKLGLGVERDGWQETEHSNPPNDNCEWLDIPLKDKAGNIYTVHFYFSHDSSELASLQIFKSEIKITHSTPKHVAGEYACKGSQSKKAEAISKRRTEDTYIPMHA